MIKIINTILLLSVIALPAGYKYNGSTKASVVLAGAVIKAQHSENTNKYKRKDCPVCKGKGWYISGDGISKVNCGYCEPEKDKAPPTIITHSPIILEQNCTKDSCKPQKTMR
jgi:hypothetical protein